MKDIHLPVIVKKDDNDTLLAYCPIFKWCHTFAENKDDLKYYLEDVVSMYFDMYREGEKNIFEWDNTLFLNFDQNGKITNDFSKEFDKSSGKVLMRNR